MCTDTYVRMYKIGAYCIRRNGDGIVAITVRIVQNYDTLSALLARIRLCSCISGWYHASSESTQTPSQQACRSVPPPANTHAEGSAHKTVHTKMGFNCTQ